MVVKVCPKYLKFDEMGSAGIFFLGHLIQFVWGFIFLGMFVNSMT